jgi:hypothetical protein
MCVTLVQMQEDDSATVSAPETNYVYAIFKGDKFFYEGEQSLDFTAYVNAPFVICNL